MSAKVGSVSFVAKVGVTRTKSKEGKEYTAFRIVIPKHEAEELQLSNGDFVLMEAKHAEWYHMLDWDEMPSTWKLLPQELKMKVEISDLGRKESRLASSYLLEAISYFLGSFQMLASATKVGHFSEISGIQVPMASAQLIPSSGIPVGAAAATTC